MWLKHFSRTLIFLSLFCKIGENADTSLRPAIRECENIKKNYQASFGNYIVGGTAASLGEFPHMVALAYDRGKGGYQFGCGGSIVSNNYVLTAAHCIVSIKKFNLAFVRGGVVDIGGKDFNPETDSKVAEINYHPKYTPRFKYNDLALLRLADTLKFTASLNAICLETNNENPTVPLIITGWGKTDYFDDEGSKVLLKAQVEAVPSDTCTKLYENTPRLPKGIVDGQLCAGNNVTREDACQGDSGGPLFIPGNPGVSRLVGVISFGKPCGMSDAGVFIRVSRYVDWVESIVWPNNTKNDF